MQVHQELLQLFATQGTLCKTIKYDGWQDFLKRIQAEPGKYGPYRTSTSLLPPNGMHMRMYGSERLSPAPFSGLSVTPTPPPPPLVQGMAQNDHGAYAPGALDRACRTSLRHRGAPQCPLCCIAISPR